MTSLLTNATYCAASNVNEPSGVSCFNNATGFSTSQYRVYIHQHANSDTDPNYVSNNILGNLA